MKNTAYHVIRRPDGTARKVELLTCPGCQQEYMGVVTYAAGLGSVTIRVRSCTICDYRTEDMVHETDWDADLAPFGLVKENTQS